MICCIWLPHFALRVVAHRHHDGLDDPLALSGVAATHPVVLDCTAAARAEGVVPGMLVSRAMGCCGDLRVLDIEDELVASAAERFVARLESLGAAVQPLEPGRVVFDVAPLDRMYGGRAGVLRRVRGAFDTPDVRIGLGPNPFVAWVATRHAPPGAWLAIEQGEARRVLADMPLSLLPIDDRLLQLLDALGLYTLGDFASIDTDKVADRFGRQGMWLHELAQGVDERVLVPRTPVEPVESDLQFPEPVANVQTLQRAVRMLVERVVANPRCVQYAPRCVVVVAWLATGGSWRSRRVLRVPTVDAGRIALTAQVGVDEVPSPVERLCVRLEEFELRTATQQGLLDQRTTALTGGDGAEAGSGGGVGAGSGGGVGGDRVQAVLRHVQAALGDDAMLQVLEVEPMSRVPERHAVLVPRQQAHVPSSGSSLRGVSE